MTVGLQQLEIYLSLEPHVKLGVWANSAEMASESLFVFKDAKGLTFPKKKHIADIPSIGMPLIPTFTKLTFDDLIPPSNSTLHRSFSDLLDKVVARDSNVTRREEQLDQLCNLILLKLDSDKKAKIDPASEVSFRACATEKATGDYIRKQFKTFHEIYPDIFITMSDKDVRFSDSTLHDCVEILSTLRLLDVGADTVSIAFQVLRSAALKQEEGQYFTPTPVIKAAIKLMDITLNDLIIEIMVARLIQLNDSFFRRTRGVHFTSRGVQNLSWGVHFQNRGVQAA